MESNGELRIPAIWQDVPEEQWEDWKWQARNRLIGLEQLKQVITLTPEEEEAVQNFKGRLTMAIPPYWAALMDPDNPKCPIRLQAVPVIDEFYVSEFDMTDPCGEDKDSPAPGLVHRYPDRVLLLANETCAMYCRYCTRRRLVGIHEDRAPIVDLEPALDYIRSHKKVRDVLISGGDPLMMSDERLDWLLGQLRAIPHVEFIRLGTRTPVTMPQRVTEHFCNVLRKHKPIWMSLHFNHPKEVTKRLRRATDMLADSGVPLGSQTVLLKGINDRSSIMKRLFHELLKCRVRPYYIYQCDPVTGTSHFRTPISVGINIMEKLRGHTSGYAVPTYVVDGPGGGGKIPIAPNYVLSQGKGVYTLRNFEGKIFTYYEEPERQRPACQSDREAGRQARQADAKRKAEAEQPAAEDVPEADIQFVPAPPLDK